MSKFYLGNGENIFGQIRNPEDPSHRIDYGHFQEGKEHSQR